MTGVKPSAEGATWLKRRFFHCYHSLDNPAHGFSASVPTLLTVETRIWFMRGNCPKGLGGEISLSSRSACLHIPALALFVVACRNVPAALCQGLSWGE